MLVVDLSLQSVATLVLLFVRLRCFDELARLLPFRLARVCGIDSRSTRDLLILSRKNLIF